MLPAWHTLPLVADVDKATVCVVGMVSAGKTALLALTKVAAKELLPLGIRVNCLAPGVIKVRRGPWGLRG